VIPQTANGFVAVALAGWIPVVLAFFACLPARRAAIVAVLVGWLVLPVATYPLHGFPDASKTSATCLGVLLGIVIFDPRRLMALRPRWVDVPMLVWCVCPVASSLSNGLGTYDGLSGAFDHAVEWGVPYMVGRLYCADPEGLRELAIGVVLGALLYMPLCLVELVWGPAVHQWVYGYVPQPLSEAVRFGGWRPTIFLQHGLMLALWMAAAALTAAWTWSTGALPRLGSVRTGVWTAALVVTTLALKSVNGWVLLGLGAAVLWSIKRFQAWVPLCLVLILPSAYVAARATGCWTGDSLVTWVAATVGPDRAQSVQFRVVNEQRLVDRARQRWVVGWGGWGRALAPAPGGKPLTPDSLWIIAFGNYGLVGLASVGAALLVPVVVFWMRVPIWLWTLPRLAPAAVLALVVALYAIDNCFNAMVNPVYMLAAGGLAGVVVEIRGGLVASAG